MAKSDTDIVWAVGGVVLAYLILRSWGVITPAGYYRPYATPSEHYGFTDRWWRHQHSNLAANWQPLNDEQIAGIRNIIG